MALNVGKESGAEGLYQASVNNHSDHDQFFIGEDDPPAAGEIWKSPAKGSGLSNSA